GAIAGRRDGFGRSNTRGGIYTAARLDTARCPLYVRGTDSPVSWPCGVGAKPHRGAFYLESIRFLSTSTPAAASRPLSSMSCRPQRAAAAFWAIARRWRALSFAARARPSATACGFLGFAMPKKLLAVACTFKIFVAAELRPTPRP